MANDNKSRLALHDLDLVRESQKQNLTTSQEVPIESYETRGGREEAAELALGDWRTKNVQFQDVLERSSSEVVLGFL